MSSTIGFIAAFISMLGWGSYLVPMKRIRDYDPFYFQALMCVAIFASSSIIAFLYNSFIFSYLGILSGILWSSGNILSVQAVKSSGLSRSAPIWMGIGIFISFIWGILFFEEALASLIIGLAGISLLIVGISLVASTGEDKESSNLKGIILTIIAGFIFGCYLVPLKLSKLQPIDFLFPMSLGILIGGLAIYFVKREKIDRQIILPGAFSGLIWNIANFTSFFAVLNLGISIGFPLTQMALFVSVLWGLLYFHEIKSRNKVIRLVAGAVVLFIGAILLGLSI